MEEAYLQDTAGDLVGVLGLSGISKNQVSRLCEEIDERREGVPGPPDQGRLTLPVNRRHQREGQEQRPRGAGCADHGGRRER